MPPPQVLYGQEPYQHQTQDPSATQVPVKNRIMV